MFLKKINYLGLVLKVIDIFVGIKIMGLNDLSCNTHPHNYYLQLLIETGLLGVLFLLLCYFYIIYRSFINFIKLLKNQHFSMSEVIILGFYFTQLWPLMQHGSFFNNWNSIILFLPMAFLLFFKEKKLIS